MAALLSLCLFASSVLAAPSTAKCGVSVRNGGFEQTPAGQDTTSPYWRLSKTQGYQYINNTNSAEYQTPYGSHAIVLNPIDYGCGITLNTQVCPGANVPLQLSYAYNLFELENDCTMCNQVDYARLVVRYGNTVIDNFQPPQPAQGAVNTVWATRTVDFTSSQARGKLSFNWGVGESCEDTTIVDMPLGLDAISLIVTP